VVIIASFMEHKKLVLLYGIHVVSFISDLNVGLVLECAMSVAVRVITVPKWTCATQGTGTQSPQKVRRTEMLVRSCVSVQRC